MAASVPYTFLHYVPLPVIGSRAAAGEVKWPLVVKQVKQGSTA